MTDTSLHITGDSGTVAAAEVEKLLKLAKQCKVTPYAACQRTGINQVTIARWKKGQHEPRLGKFLEFRDAIIIIARERGTLPEGVVL